MHILVNSIIKTLHPRQTLFVLLILLVQLLQAQQALNYDEAIIYGDNKLKESSLQDAKAYYQMALRFKPEDPYAKQKIADIIVKMQAKMESEEAYYDLIDKADELNEAGKLNMAIIQYQNALNIIPDDDYAKEQVNIIIKFQANEKEKLENYEQLMKQGKALVATKDYDQAIIKFKEATQLFPANTEPYDQLNVTKTLKTEWIEKQAQCRAKTEEASRYLLINNYVKALELYNEALAIIPDDQEALIQIKEIKPLANTQNKYNKQVERADELYINKDFIAAQLAYSQANKLWPEKTYASDMLNKIDVQLAEQRIDLDKNYNTFIHRGDSLFEIASYTEAKGEFNLALNLKPTESYPKNKLAAIETYFISQQKAFEANYNHMIAVADSAFNANAYILAKEKFETALTVRPEDTYPQEQIALIELKMVELEDQIRLNNAYQAIVTQADQLAGAGQYDLAIAKYHEAQAMKTKENYPVEQIEAIQLIMTDAKKQREIDEKYQEQVVVAVRLFQEENLEQSKLAWQNALELKPFESMPKEKITIIDSLVIEKARQAKIDQHYQGLLTSGDSLQNLKFYSEALSTFEEAALVKPKDQIARQKIQTVKTIQVNIEKEAARKRAYEENITKADDLFEKENYELAKSAYEKALTFNNKEEYPKNKITEINQLLVKFAAEREARFKEAVSNGSASFNQGNYKAALLDFQIAASIKPDNAFVGDKIKECENQLAEQMKAIMAEYNQTISEADKLYQAKIYDKAIASYKKAATINPEETYPGQMIDKITKYIEENAITDIVNKTWVVASKSTEKLTFEPVPINVRKSNYLLVKAKSLTGKPASVIFSYGSNTGKNGGFVVTIPEGEQSNDFIIRVGNQYKWFSEDNNWLEIYPENGDIELTLVRISTSN